MAKAARVLAALRRDGWMEARREYRLVTRPVALGSGEPMVKNLPVGRRLQLTEATPYPDGTVITVYRRPA